MRWSPPREALPSERVERNDWKTLRTLLPYLWAYKGRVLFALALPGRRKAGDGVGADPAEGHRRRPVTEHAGCHRTFLSFRSR